MYRQQFAGSLILVLSLGWLMLLPSLADSQDKKKPPTAEQQPPTAEQQIKEGELPLPQTR